MAVRIKDGMIPYTGGTGIEITDNHVINVLLRALNNLIMVNEDRELYVDLQLAVGIKPIDDFPVGVTTGKILQADGRPQSGLILNRKTTSGDYCRWIYANDQKLYYDPGTGVRNQVFLSSDVADLMIQIENLIDVDLSDYYTKTEVDGLIGSISTISLVILADASDLPAVGDTNKIYLAPNSSDPSIYDEYVWDVTNQTWVIVGTTAINLSNYVTLNTNQTITGTKTFTSEPVLPNKTTDATNNGTKPATEAQVYKVAQDIPTNLSDLNNDTGFIGQSAVGNGTITIKQGGTTKGTFTTNQSGNTTINLDAGGGGGGGGSVDNTPYGPSWDGVTNVAPSKNAIYDKIESIVAGEQDVKVWNYTMAGFTQAEMQEISLWCMNENHSAIIKWRDHDAIAPLNLYIFGNYYTDSDDVAHLMFYGMREFNNLTSTADGDYTTRYNSMIEIQYDGNTYTLDTSSSHQNAGNYLTVNGGNYTTPFMPTYNYQPATKGYVDSRNWTGTLSQYNALQSIDPDVVYNITSLS